MMRRSLCSRLERGGGAVEVDGKKKEYENIDMGIGDGAWG